MLKLNMCHPVFSSISSQWRVVPNTVAAQFVVIVGPDQNAHASLRKDRMRRLESDMIT
jgi:hypothetical protein